MGVKSVTLFDQTPTAIEDLSSQFYLTPGDVGFPRAVRCVSKLAELNQYVRVSVLDVLTSETAGRFHVIVAADQFVSEAVALNDIARAHGHKFVAAETRGLFGRIFVDFGASHRVDDTDGGRSLRSNLRRL